MEARPMFLIDGQEGKKGPWRINFLISRFPFFRIVFFRCWKQRTDPSIIVYNKIVEFILVNIFYIN